MAPAETPLLQAQHLSLWFGQLPVLQQISLTLHAGEVVGLVGRRGAGKSVLLEVLAGLQTPQQGQVWVNGQVTRLNPRRAHRLGIELVSPVPQLNHQLDGLQNIFLGRELGRWAALGFPDWVTMANQARQVLAALEMPADLLSARTGALTDEQRQVMALARALCSSARVLLVDDVLAALSFERQQRLLALLQARAQQGVAILISSDNLKPLFALTQRLLVLSAGQLVAERRTAEVTPREIVELMVGATQAAQVTPIIWALESYHQAQQQAEELRRVQAQLQQSLAAQGSLNQQLVERLRDQVQALDQLNLALQAAQRRLMTEREQERKALARELHDQVMQDLLSFNYQLEELEDETALHPWQPDLAAIRGGIRQVVGDLRLLCSDLRPPTIDSHGLAAALRSHTQEWAERAAMGLTLDLDPALGRLPEAIELSLFRIVQEGLNNVRKHAHAQQVWVRVQRTPARVVVEVRDDGQGLPAPMDLAALSAARHFGLLGISERVALLGGTLAVTSLTGQGTLLRVEIPSPSPTA